MMSLCKDFLSLGIGVGPFAKGEDGGGFENLRLQSDVRRATVWFTMCCQQLIANV